MEATIGSRLDAALKIATNALLDELNPSGHWSGKLSSSALSTATAITALATVDQNNSTRSHETLIHNGLTWLANHANADGGWGDTVCSKSNISTTALVWAAFGAARADEQFRSIVDRAEAWLRGQMGVNGPGVPVQTLVRAIEDRYGADRTFSVPILMTCALSGRLGLEGWRYVRALPFELAALPHQLFGALRLPVVSYALPALIAIGQIIHAKAPSSNAIARGVRGLTASRTLRVLTSLQPENGGFLEATPLTSFVTMSLAGMGRSDHVVARKGAAFLRHSVLPDGSWPIDTNLATWVTTLSIKALSHQPDRMTPEQRMGLREWLLDQQYQTEHPYTHAAPFGWAWTDLPGGVPDADDTAGALLALLSLSTVDSQTGIAGLAACRWLLHLQNSDGGMPTFCRGWGALPFDRSSPDLTGHAVAAWSAWLPQMDNDFKARTMRAIARAQRFLARSQQGNGSWIPLWFGNEHAPDDINPTYGTAQVVMALRALQDRGFKGSEAVLAAGVQWLVDAQNDDGSWGGFRGSPSSVEETALAIQALAGTAQVHAVDRGIDRLITWVESGEWRKPSPIGFYFAKLWYFERLYPLIFTVGALGRVAALQKIG